MDRKVVRPKECNHPGPCVTQATRYGCAVRCLVCDTVGPARETPMEALQALHDMTRSDEPTGRRGSRGNLLQRRCGDVRGGG
jgi:hypothetical protein